MTFRIRAHFQVRQREPITNPLLGFAGPVLFISHHTPENSFLPLSGALRASGLSLGCMLRCTLGSGTGDEPPVIEFHSRPKAEFLDSLRLLGEGGMVDWQEMQP
ncbi:hypothetical protein [Paracoccus marcusii]|uniref:hypothetical protein n=1 Tax=Paracoccus marcusii TaxID=59779 RepID=UPI002ECFF943